MPEPQDPKALLLQHLAWIRRVAGSLGRPHGLSDDDIEDFASFAVTRLIDNDYATVRKFQGKSAFTTFLTVVVTMLYRDFRVSELGRWRPSAAARRLGPIAVRLETLVQRDGYDLAQAAELLRSSGQTTLSDRELRDLVAGLPTERRGRPRRTGAEPLESIASPHGADLPLNQTESQSARDRVKETVNRVLAELPTEDRVIVQLRFWHGRTVADIARILGLEPKPLYRRLERLFEGLRPELERAGISLDVLRDLLHGERQ